MMAFLMIICVDLGVIKNVNTDSAHVGEVVVFTITITNYGSINATHVIIEDMLPLGYSYVSQSTSVGLYDENSGIWIIPLIAPETSVSLDVSVEVLQTTGYLNTAKLTDLDQDDTDDTNNSDTATLGVVLPEKECLTVYNEFSPNGDGVNDVFVIECIEDYPDNKLEVYNRWGNIVYSKDGYHNEWDGTSNGRETINKSRELPDGTYYFVLKLDKQSKPRIGWLYLNR